MSKAVKSAALAAFAILVATGCTSYESAYERAVYDEEPVYCYQSLGSADCYRTPHRRDDARLVNYYGPAPTRTAPPRLSKAARPQPPPAPSGDTPAAPAEVAERPAAEPSAAAQPEAEKPEEKKTGWRDWLPLATVGFGALQVIAAFAL